MPMQMIDQNPEVRLVEMLSDIKTDSPYWRAIDFRFFELLEHYRNPVQIKIVINLIYDLLKNYDGAIFISQDNSITVLCRDATPALFDKVVFQLRYLLMDDPLAYLPNGEENPEFCKTYDLAVDFDGFMKLAKKRMVIVSRGGSAQAAMPSAAAKPTLKPFTPNQLVQIERDLTGIDLTPVLRRQSVCAALPHMPMNNTRRVFDELYIHIAPLRQLLGVETDFNSNRWLFKYLTGLLDVRMLSFLSQYSMKFLASPISINLNIDTVLSSHFTEFDAVVKTMPKVSIVVEVHISDVFTDIAAFIAARTQLQRMGYRLCLDGLTNYSLPQIDREKLGFDLAKLQWNADLESDVKSAEVQKLGAAIRNYGGNRIILCRCDNEHAVKFGQALGITLFQGRALDKLVDPLSKVEN